MPKPKGLVDEPTMSDTTVLVTVEDLISRAMGAPDANIVNFKLIQTIIHILARQQRLLTQRVEIRNEDLKREGRKTTAGDESTESSTEGPPPGKGKAHKSPRTSAKKERSDRRRSAGTKDKGDRKEREGVERVTPREKEMIASLGKTAKIPEVPSRSATKQTHIMMVNKEGEEEETEDCITKEKENRGLERVEIILEDKKERKYEEREKITQTEKEKFDKKEEKGPDKAEKIKEERPGKGKLVEKYEGKTEKERLPAKEPTLERKKSEQRSSYDIEITETIVDNEKILVVGKAPTTRIGARSSISSIDVVTQSQFALLESAVKQLARMAAPLQLQLPDNKQLMSDVMSGAATLPDAMQTLQINSRLQAAESALVRMTGLMTQLAAAGELPDKIVEQMEALKPSLAEIQTQADQLYQQNQANKPQPLTGKKSVVINPKVARSKTPESMKMKPAETLTPDLLKASLSTVSRVSRVSSMTAGRGDPCVTYEEMEAALEDLRDEILKYLNKMTGKATTSTETALRTVKLLAEKLNIALRLDERISFLHSMVEDYAEQLTGFDSGLTTQMQSFQDLMAQLRADLQAGLLQLENVQNNAETAAVLELTERYDEMASELDSTLQAHNAISELQGQLSAEMRSLVTCMEMLREQKADRDEVLDGLRDKADSSRLAGLLTEVEFAGARADLERRIILCYDKFDRQDAAWQEAIKDLKDTTEKKAELIGLLSMRDDTQRQLQDLNDKIRLLAAVLGEPKAALLTRKLAEGALCGACRERALMEPREATHGAPRLLPALRPPPVGASEEPCLADLASAGAVEKRHMCHRWCGGSHTLVSESTRHAPAAPELFEVATRKFAGYGDDGRLYMMEEECQPCMECNMSDEQPQPALGRGAGDEGIEPESLECTCPP